MYLLAILLSKVFSLCHNDSGVTDVMGIAIAVGFYYSRDLVVIEYNIIAFIYADSGA